jgi:hypothetical protein
MRQELTRLANKGCAVNNFPQEESGTNVCKPQVATCFKATPIRLQFKGNGSNIVFLNKIIVLCTTVCGGTVVGSKRYFFWSD